MKLSRMMVRAIVLPAVLIFAGASFALAQRPAQRGPERGQERGQERQERGERGLERGERGLERAAAARAGWGGFDPAAIFDMLDTDKDGQISREEYTAGVNRMREMRGERGGERPGAGQARGEGRGEAGAGAPMERFRQGMIDRLKEHLGAEDKEWAVLRPRIEKVMELNRAQRPGPPGLRDGDATAAQPEVEALRRALDDEKTTPEVLKSRTETLREARKKQAAELEAARSQLRELVTARQEAALILVGVLD